MSLLRFLVTGAAVAAGVHYVTKKRPDGSSIMDDLKSKAPEWMDKAKPYVDQVKDQISKATQGMGNMGSKNYSHNYNHYSQNPGGYNHPGSSEL